MADVTDNSELEYINGWAKKMLEIWQEQIQRLKIVRSGQLYQSFQERINASQDGQTIYMKFAEYGIYQAFGTGYGYNYDNCGDLRFRADDYRHEHRLDKPRKVGPAWGGYMTSGKPRKRRDWINKKFFASVMALKEDLARITGEQGAQIICDALEDARRSVQ